MMKEEICKAIEKKSFGVYVGAGVSMGSGLLDWKNLLLSLITLVESKGIVPDKIGEMRNLVNSGQKYLLVAEEIRELIPKDLETMIRDTFEDRTKKPNPTHDSIVKLKSKFLITTNYDSLIEKALVKNFDNFFPTVYTYKDASSINYSLWNNDHFLLKAHGDAKNPKEIILTERDYRNIIFSQVGYQSILHAIFSTNSILFVGVSLNDPELLLLLGYIHNIFHGGSPTHYALVDKNTISSTEVDRWRKDFNIECKLYDPVGNHIEVKNFIDEIIADTGELNLS